ncbi:DUF389 domain-containing protein [Halomicroarcula limicola]|uniref:DUF389 domain-containing protein n=1 Tax=Haloarcula limicola TaxID=1429915 RepID=A0A8J8C360_9EURY|nr:DUF389 domain-containing protein [Halomicroarcula limicola]MBV0923937.1 DUF389 domain-containing protein [Halomicroarcula limicola]
MSEEHESEVASVLDDEGADYTALSEDGTTHVFAPVPTPAVGDVLDAIEERDVGSDAYSVVTRAEFAETPRLPDLQERYSSTVRTLSSQELRGKIREMQWPYQIYYVGTLLSVIAAAAGLLADLPALVIGSMIIAPQVSSALAVPAGTILGDWEMVTSSLRNQVLGLALGIAGAALFAVLLRQFGFVSPRMAVTNLELLGLRASPTLLSTIGAIVAGIVGAFGYTTEQSTSLIGVMVAAAIVPAVAAVGIGIAWSVPVFTYGAFLLLAVNLLAINIGATCTLVAMGYLPKWWQRDGPHLREFRRSLPSKDRVTVYAMLGLLLVAAAGTGALTGLNIAFAQDVERETEETLSQPAYDSLTLIDVQPAYGGPPETDEPVEVTVAVSRTANESYPDIAATLERGIERRTGQDVKVVVEFTGTRTAK